MLGRTIGRVHQLSPPPSTQVTDPSVFLAGIWAALGSDTAVPGFVREAVQRILTDEAPELDRAFVLSHNDLNPTSLLFDGTRLLLLDWDTPGLNALAGRRVCAAQGRRTQRGGP
jgi:hypothetical protein